MRCELNFCMICDGEIGPGQRTQVEVEWSNRSKMPIGICINCATSHRYATEDGKKSITQWHWCWWDKTHGKYDPEIVIV